MTFCDRVKKKVAAFKDAVTKKVKKGKKDEAPKEIVVEVRERSTAAGWKRPGRTSVSAKDARKRKQLVIIPRKLKEDQYVRPVLTYSSIDDHVFGNQRSVPAREQLTQSDHNKAVPCQDQRPIVSGNRNAMSVGLGGGRVVRPQQPEGTAQGCQQPKGTDQRGQQAQGTNQRCQQPASTNQRCQQSASTNQRCQQPASTNQRCQQPASTNQRCQQSQGTNQRCQQPPVDKWEQFPDTVEICQEPEIQRSRALPRPKCSYGRPPINQRPVLPHYPLGGVGFQSRPVQPSRPNISTFQRYESEYRYDLRRQEGEASVGVAESTAKPKYRKVGQMACLAPTDAPHLTRNELENQKYIARTGRYTVPRKSARRGFDGDE